MGGGRGMVRGAPEQPQPLLQRADAAFARGDRAAAAQDMVKAAALLRTQGARFAREDKAAVDESAGMIDKAAKSIAKADAKMLRLAFGRADLALARGHQRLAGQAWAKKDSRLAGMNLMAAAMQLQNGATWLGYKATQQQVTDTRNAGLLGQKMAAGEKVNPADADKAIKLIGEETHGLWGMLTRPRK
jgi:hypothetical protein